MVVVAFTSTALLPFFLNLPPVPEARSSRSMVRQAHHDRLDLPLVLRVSKDALRSRRSNPDFHQRFKVKICLTFACDRRRYLHWVFELKRFGLSSAALYSEGLKGTDIA